MLDKAIQRASAEIAGKVGETIDQKLHPKTEWHKFYCELGHSFAVEIPTGIPVKDVMNLYGKTRCPICYTQELTKENNL